MTDSDEEYYEVPLRDQRYFGAGIKRKRVHFVPSTTSLPASPKNTSKDGSKSSASERYLAVVFKKSQSEPPLEKESAEVARDDNHQVATQSLQEGIKSQTIAAPTDTICDVCKLPVDSSHAGGSDKHTASLVHQICLPHSHPPSALDRKRKGINILQSYGWDPDARLGLGASNEGILHPVKAKEKRDTVGLGHGVQYEEEARIKPRKVIPKPKEIKKLDAGKVRALDVEQKRKDKRLRDMFYASDDVERYLGGG